MEAAARQKINGEISKVCLLGATFDTGNYGVNALAESAIKLITAKWPHAEIYFVDSRENIEIRKFAFRDKELTIKTIPLRFSPNIFARNHLLRYIFRNFFIKMPLGKKIKQNLYESNPNMKLMLDTDLVVDITGGDSFSDIYGFKRFAFVFLSKWYFLLLKKDLILLPQMYGPFNSSITKRLARYIITNSYRVYSRDNQGLRYLREKLGINFDADKMQFIPDVAFLLDSIKPQNFEKTTIAKARSGSERLIGLNISGLLYNGGYTRNNMFGLTVDYRKLIIRIIERLLNDEKTTIVLIPHVFPENDMIVESDLNACSEIHNILDIKYGDRICILENQFNHNEIKYIIGLCDFYIGSRMHSCIAALSQYVPAIGLAYSDKFTGVFESAGMGGCVIDARDCDENQAIERIHSIYTDRDKYKKELIRIIPEVKMRVSRIFEN